MYMEWTQVLTIIGVNVALIGALAVLLVWVVTKLDNDVKSISQSVDKLAARLDGHATRIDQLYKMFVDLLKEQKNK
jgi:hypothetical protein